MRFCCSNFEGNYNISNNFAPNIRIVKFKSESLILQNFDRNILSKRNDLKYFITLGYEKFSLNIPLMNICFCPYCGTNLKMFYDKNEYLNEIEGETFTL
jgi:hypothetical protein